MAHISSGGVTQEAEAALVLESIDCNCVEHECSNIVEAVLVPKHHKTKHIQPFKRSCLHIIDSTRESFNIVNTILLIF